MSDSSLAFLAHTIKVRTTIYACTCIIHLSLILATYRQRITMLSEIFVYLTLIGVITVSFHLCFLLSAVLSKTSVPNRTHDRTELALR